MNVSYENNILRLDGAQTFDNADSLNNEGLDYLKSSTGDVTVDAKALTDFNSAMLAILMQWQDQVKQNDGALKIVHAPDQLDGLIRLTQLEKFLILS